MTECYKQPLPRFLKAGNLLKHFSYWIFWEIIYHPIL